MRAIAFAPFEPQHLDLFLPGFFDRLAFAEPYLSVLRSEWPGRAVSAIRDGRVLGIAGVVIRENCAYPWMVLSDEFRQGFPILICKVARRVLQALQETEGITRIEVTVAADFASARKWVERMGFREAGQEENQVRYVK